jgi:hypothetical protein
MAALADDQHRQLERLLVVEARIDLRLVGARDLTDADLARAYRSTVDPRLNYEQALEVAMLVVRKQAQLAAPL